MHSRVCSINSFFFIRYIVLISYQIKSFITLFNNMFYARSRRGSYFCWNDLNWTMVILEVSVMLVGLGVLTSEYFSTVMWVSFCRLAIAIISNSYEFSILQVFFEKADMLNQKHLLGKQGLTTKSEYLNREFRFLLLLFAIFCTYTNRQIYNWLS